MNSQKLTLPHFLWPAALIRWILIAWLLAVFTEYMLLPPSLQNLSGLAGLAQMNFPRVLAITGLATLLLVIGSAFFKSGPVTRWAIPALFFALAIQSLYSSYTHAFLVVCLLILGVLVVYAFRGWNRRPEPIRVPRPVHPAYLWCTALLSLGFFLIISLWTAGRVGVIGTSTYDFGLFAQMFHNMKETGLPMTTLERDVLLSHFDVHVSPIYYLMLPFYCLAPYPATLQILQAAVMASAVIPLWKIGGQYGLSGGLRTLLCAALLLYPAFGCGASYDLHENCFLTPLLLWLLYSIGAKNSFVTAIAALLTLMIKEDAAVYVAVVALWLLVRTLLRHKKLDLHNLLTAVLLLAASLVWFFLATGYLAQNGDGVMTYRYDNFMYNGSGSLITVIFAVIMNPMKAIYECVDPEKLEYIAMTLLPLLGLPLLTRRYERYILLIPYVLVNLMSDYQYQHSIWFQYNFGSIALLFYLTAVNLADFKIEWHRAIPLAIAVILCCTTFYKTAYPRAKYYGQESLVNYEYYQKIRNTLAQIPEDASVTATGYYTTPLSNREILYDLRYTTREHLLESEYVVMNIVSRKEYSKYATGGKDNGLENLISILERNGYALFAQIDGLMVIYRQTNIGN